MYVNNSEGLLAMTVKATPKQLLVSHPPSALKLMRAGAFLASNGRQNHKFGRKWSSKLQVQLVQKLKQYTFVLCGYRWKYMRAEIEGG